MAVPSPSCLRKPSVPVPGTTVTFGAFHLPRAVWQRGGLPPSTDGQLRLCKGQQFAQYHTASEGTLTSTPLSKHPFRPCEQPTLQCIRPLSKHWRLLRTDSRTCRLRTSNLTPFLSASTVPCCSLATPLHVVCCSVSAEDRVTTVTMWAPVWNACCLFRSSSLPGMHKKTP